MNILAIIFLSLYFFLLLYFSLQKSKSLTNSYINLLKPLFPSWKFFDHYEESNLLFYRIGKNENPLGEWTKVYIQPRAKIKNLFINSDGNLILAIQSHLGQLLYDIDHSQSEEIFSHNLSYKITKNAIEHHLKKHDLSDNYYQFKLATTTSNDNVFQDLLVSPTYRLVNEKKI